MLERLLRDQRLGVAAGAQQLDLARPGSAIRSAIDDRAAPRLRGRRASAASSWRSISSSPELQKPGSERSTPTIAPELLGRPRAAGAEQVEVGGHEALALLLVAPVHRQREQVAVGVRVHVAGRVDEVRDVGPPGAVVVVELDGVAEQVRLRRQPQLAEALDRQLALLAPRRCGWRPRSGSSRPGGTPRRPRRRASRPAGRAARRRPGRARAGARARSSRRRSRRSRPASAGS